MGGAARIPSPIDDLELPDRLTARVVRPGWQPLLHGYDVQADLSRHYAFGEVMLTALLGEAPEPAAGRAFETALTFLAPIPVGQGPSHAAMLCRLCGAQPAAVLAVGAITLAEQARSLVAEQGDLLAWLDERVGPCPDTARSRSDDEAAAVERLRAALSARGSDAAAAESPLGLVAACLAVLYRVGLRAPWQLEAAICCARWPVVIAEAMAATAGRFRDYPMRLPDFLVPAEAP